MSVFGAVGGPLLSGILVLVVALAGESGLEMVVLAPVLALSGAASAAGSLALARMAVRRERLEAGATDPCDQQDRTTAANVVPSLSTISPTASDPDKIDDGAEAEAHDGDHDWHADESSKSHRLDAVEVGVHRRSPLAGVPLPIRMARGHLAPTCQPEPPTFP